MSEGVLDGLFIPTGIGEPGPARTRILSVRTPRGIHGSSPKRKPRGLPDCVP